MRKILGSLVLAAATVALPALASAATLLDALALVNTFLNALIGLFITLAIVAIVIIWIILYLAAHSGEGKKKAEDA